MEQKELQKILEGIIMDGSGRCEIGAIITQLDAPHYPIIIAKIAENLRTASFCDAIIPNTAIALPDEHGRITIGHTHSLEKDTNVATLVEAALGLKPTTLLDFKRYHHITSAGFEIETGYELDETSNYAKTIEVYLHIDNAETLLHTLKNGIDNYDTVAKLAHDTRELMSRFGSDFLSLDLKEKSRMEKGETHSKQKSIFAIAIIASDNITIAAIQHYNAHMPFPAFSDEEIEQWMDLREKLERYKQAWNAYLLPAYSRSKFDLECEKRIESYINVAGKDEVAHMVAEWQKI